jgi:prepilin signal peptidase PulO-like enzyme (type II secretory pathway)
MNRRQKVFLYQGKPPAYLIPLVILLVIIVFAVLAVFGLFLGIAVGIALIIFGVMRLFSPGSKNKYRTIEEDGRTTIVLDKKDYEVIEKGK